MNEDSSMKKKWKEARRSSRKDNWKSWFDLEKLVLQVDEAQTSGRDYVAICEDWVKGKNFQVVTVVQFAAN